ncbi:hypothetical protein DFH08DRAFT_870995 [Mycena albidolilacea]|uniref:Uncharacterized protein n=1 Tax=Mycena albidolilacea TaxID=1033008 RepID=A0AAD7ER49_9AGAR|nr:hypothetical protein DFH08DRAFT_870995 [Mycena albidolilacea]
MSIKTFLHIVLGVVIERHFDFPLPCFPPLRTRAQGANNAPKLNLRTALSRALLDTTTDDNRISFVPCLWVVLLMDCLFVIFRLCGMDNSLLITACALRVSQQRQYSRAASMLQDGPCAACGVGASMWPRTGSPSHGTGSRWIYRSIVSLLVALFMTNAII